jgi:threonine-phosphate decarboxylase
MNEHGGNIHAASKKTGIPMRKILDFSASIHFLGMPGRAAMLMKREMKNLSHYPEPFSTQLSMYIGKKFRVDEESVICGNGSTELLYLIPRALKPKKVLIPAPTFSEYERACSLNTGTKIVRYPLDPKSDFSIEPEVFISMMAGRRNQRRTLPCDMVFLCNPNNPTGHLLRKTDVLKIAAVAKKIKCYLVVDEAFIDFHPEESVVREVRNNPHLIVVRSMTKFYAMPGLRIGFGVFPQSIIRIMRLYKEPWSVNALAQKAGAAVLQDDRWQEYARRTMAREKKIVEAGLDKAGVDFIPSQANYYLIRTGKAREIVACLERKGILVRNCSNFAGLDGAFIRIAVRSRKENSILMKELAMACGQKA